MGPLMGCVSFIGLAAIASGCGASGRHTAFHVTFEVCRKPNGSRGECFAAATRSTEYTLGRCDQEL